jgi:exopolyphosphatase/guanosine-5'-triphosphate,3'-diphosphate pyrophosphatase
MRKIASIDIGSNTVRLLILEAAADHPLKAIDSHRAITRLGEAMDTEKRLLEERMRATLDVLSRFHAICQAHGNVPIHAVATSAVREAANRDEFLRRAREEAGVAVEVIPWEEEARLTLDGVFWKLPRQDADTLVFDIGGGSTEFIFARRGEVQGACGTLLGTVRLTERFISRHPVDRQEYLALQNHLREEIARVREKLPQRTPGVLIGTAGTVTTLAAIARDIFPYDPDRVHGVTLSRQAIQAIQDDLLVRSLGERLAIRALEPGREDLIIAGTLLTLEIMDAFRQDTLTISEYSMREGILLRALAGSAPKPEP